MNAVPQTQRANLVAASLAFLIASVAVAAGLVYCRDLEKRYVHALAPDFNDPKLQGVALQKEALDQPDLLVLYGSSELLQDIPTSANKFFQDYPTGFRVFPVGKAGTTSLAVLQRVAAMGDELQGRKVAYSISPGFFFTEIFDPKYYEGNFSELQATELLFSNKLSFDLKRDIARRMLDYPRTLQDRPLLDYTLRRLSGDSWVDRGLYAAAWPLGRLQIAIGRAQDHVQTAAFILEKDEHLIESQLRARRGLNWSDLMRRAAQFATAAQLQNKNKELVKRRLPKAARDKVMRETITKAREWKDVELLMRTFKELGAQPLLLSMPVEDVRLEVVGASAATRTEYLNRLDTLAERYDFPLLDFRGHQTDPSFLVDFSDHLSGKGWIYYNKALDDFFHGRISHL